MVYRETCIHWRSATISRLSWAFTDSCDCVLSAIPNALRDRLRGVPSADLVDRGLNNATTSDPAGYPARPAYVTLLGMLTGIQPAHRNQVAGAPWPSA